MSNNILVVFEIILVVLFLIPTTLTAQWSSDPSVNTPICIDTSDQHEVDIVSDGLGGAYLVWRDHRHESNILWGDLYMQRINSDGVSQWNNNGMVLMQWPNGQFAPIAITDAQHGTFMVWEQNLGGFYNTELHAQRIDTAGAPYWSGMGLPIVQIFNSTEFSHQAIPDGLGGFIVAWQRLPQFPGTTDIYAQRLINSGAPQWPVNGQSICTATESQSDPTLCSDGFGGAFISWTDWRAGYPTLDIFAQHISATGLISFMQDGISICNESGIQEDPALLAGGNPAEAFMVWHDFRHVNGDIFAQKIDTSGASLWAINGIPICNEVHEQNNAAIISDNAGGFIAAWTDLRDDAGNIYAQRVNANGVDQWTANGIPICSASGIQDESVMIPDGSGGAIIVWLDLRSDAFGDIYAQRINASGQALWTTNGVAICTASGEQTNPVLINDGQGGAIIAWDDGRMGLLHYDIYAQWVDNQGNLAGVVGIEDDDPAIISDFMLYQNYPNPFNPSTTIEFYLPKSSDVSLKIFNVLGEEIATLLSASLLSGSHTYLWDAGDMPSGIYFYRIQAGSYQEMKKMVLMK